MNVHDDRHERRMLLHQLTAAGMPEKPARSGSAMTASGGAFFACLGARRGPAGHDVMRNLLVCRGRTFSPAEWSSNPARASAHESRTSRHRVLSELFSEISRSSIWPEIEERTAYLRDSSE